MVLDIIFSLSLSLFFFFFNSLCITFYAPSFTLVFISAFMYLSIYLSLFYIYVFIYLYVHLLLSIFFVSSCIAHLKSTFHRIIYRLVRRLHLFFYLLYIYQLTHVNFSLSRFACLSLYKNAPLLSHVPSFSLAFSYVCISCVFDGISIQTKKKSLTI